MDRWMLGKLLCGAGLGLIWGCSPELRALPGEGVVLIDDGKAAVAEQNGVSVFVRGAFVPWSSRGEPTGIYLEITNGGPAAVALDLGRVVLIDPQGHRRLPDSPVQMIEAFQTAEAERRPVRIGVSISYGYRHGHYPYHFHHPYYYDDPWVDRDAYERAERAKFLSRLLTSRRIEAEELVSGYVVFSYRLQRDDAIRLEVTLTPDQPTSSPVEEPPPGSRSEGVTFAFSFVGK